MKTVFFDTVCFDVDTQIDFLYPAGALYVPGAETIVDRVAALNRWAASHGICVISTMDAHTEDDPEFRTWPPHCVAGTAGQQKPVSTLLESRVTVSNVPLEPTRGSAADLGVQILLEKQALDCFTNVNLEALLDRLSADRYIVYGVVTEICVKYAALGLLKTGRRVELVTDAVKELDPSQAAEFLAAFTTAGGVLTTSAEVMSQV
jgi:nicotinamidase/pyrazinamidase